MPAHQTLYQYIWRHSRRDQLAILVLALLAQPFYFLTWTLPKRSINGPIHGKGFEAEGATQRFLHVVLEFPVWISGQWELMTGFPLERIPYLVALSVSYLVLVGLNGFLKFLVNTMKGRLGERLLRRLRFELIDRVLRFPPNHLRRVKQAEIASMVKASIDLLTMRKASKVCSFWRQPTFPTKR